MRALVNLAGLSPAKCERQPREPARRLCRGLCAVVASSALLLVGFSASAAPSASTRIELSPVKLGLIPAWANPMAPGIKIAAADGDEPSKPGTKKTDEPSKPGTKKTDEPSKPSTGTPSKGDEPGGKGGDEPSKGGDEPGKGPAKGEPQGPAKIVKAKSAASVSYGIGVHIRALFIHKWFLNLFLDESTNLNSMAFGGEFIRRKGNFDLIASVDFGFYSPTDGNYLGNGKNPVVDTDYVQFRNLNILAFAVHFIWHHDFTEWLSLVYGAGVGVGIVLGSIHRISNDPARCTRENAGDTNACFPKGQQPNSPETWPVGEGGDSPNNPFLYKEDDVWPVVPVVHLLVGLNFKISEQFSVRLDGGFRNAFYVGATGHYFF